jgi:NAD(P)H-hydrate repair Nnr-like enzyme with NAD(P)H-hydrate dehydratase domain
VVFGCGLPAHSEKEKSALNLWKPFLATLAKVGVAPNAPVVVVDGGGLAIFAAWRKHEKTAFHAPLIFTPHPKEARDTLHALTEKSPAASLSRQALFEKLRAELAAKVGAGALLLKGAYPMIGALHANAGAAFNIASLRLATAGSGDALAGGAAAAALRLESRKADDDPEARAMGALALAVSAQGRAARTLPPGALAREIARASGAALEEILRAL